MVLHLLQKLGVLEEKDLLQLKEHWPRVIRNHRGDEVGELRIAFELWPKPSL